MLRISRTVLTLSRLLITLLVFASAFVPAAVPAAADGRVPPVRGLRCVFEGAQPEPNSSRQQVLAVSIAFRCFDARGNLVLRLFDAQFFVDGIARDFQRAGEFDTEILFVEFPGGLAAGTHTARVVVAGNGSFSWRFTVTSGGASHTPSGSGSADGSALSHPSACSPATVGGLIAACRPPGGGAPGKF